MNVCTTPVITTTAIPAHNVFKFNDITFSSNFDNGNLARVERTANRPFEFKIWTAPDNMGTEHQSRHCSWFYFTITGAPMGCVLRICIANASGNSGLWKHDMRPVYRCNTTNQRWVRIKSSVRFQKDSPSSETPNQVVFEHGVDMEGDKISFAFTYPYTYTQLIEELDQHDAAHTNNFSEQGSIFYQRELLTKSGDNRRIDLLTITNIDQHMSKQEREPLHPGLFPEAAGPTSRPPVFHKEVIFISSRVHAGEVPAQHTFKGILNLLLDPHDPIASALRSHYLFKLIPMLNPDGVYRGHFRMDQYGQNLNRYYTAPCPTLQPSIYAAKTLLDYFASTHQLSVYMDFHAHASKRGCFIYGNILESIDDQVQNQLYCKYIALNTPHFDYEGCLFSKEHMFRIDPGDQAKGLTAEGSGRVATYLAYGLIHSYTIECNYNTSRIGNDVPPMEQDYASAANMNNVTPATPFTTNPEKYTPSSYYGVGRACITAMLDLRNHNPHSRVPKSKFKTSDRVKQAVLMEVKNRKEFFGKSTARKRAGASVGFNTGTSASNGKGPGAAEGDGTWKRLVDPEHRIGANGAPPEPTPTPPPHPPSRGNGEDRGGSSLLNEAGILFVSAKDMNRGNRGRRATTTNPAANPTSSSNPPATVTTSSSNSNATPTRFLPLTEANLHIIEGGAGGPGVRLQSLWGKKAGGSPGDGVPDRGVSGKNGARAVTDSEGGNSLGVGSDAPDGKLSRRLRSLSFGGEGENKGPVPGDDRDSPSAVAGGTDNSDCVPMGGMRELMGSRGGSSNNTNSASVYTLNYPYPPAIGSGGAFQKRTGAGGGSGGNRKILGKTLHAAGVALLIGTPAPVVSTTPTPSSSVSPPPSNLNHGTSTSNNYPDSRPSSSHRQMGGGIAYNALDETVIAVNGEVGGVHMVHHHHPHVDLVVTGTGTTSRCSSRGAL
eukprot:gene30739-37141_t